MFAKFHFYTGNSAMRDFVGLDNISVVKYNIALILALKTQ
jgi:hypothetical protein